MARRDGALVAPALLACILCVYVLAGCAPDATHVSRAAPTQGDPGAGKQAIVEYGCGACHRIPGIAGATATVGPSLAHFRARHYVAGVLVNNEANARLWVGDPQKVQPNSLMPDLHVTAEDARDIVAYLYRRT